MVVVGGGGGWGGDKGNRAKKKRKKSLPPIPLSRSGTNTHPQARVSIFETKMETRKCRCLMPVILWKNRRL